MNIRYYRVLPFACLLLLLGSCKEKEVTPEDMEITTKDYSRRVCPRAVNDNITMDSVVFYADNPDDYYYYYTVSGIMDNDYELPVLIDGQRSIYLTNLKNSPEMEPLMGWETTVHHVFISKATGKVLYDLKFVSAEYNSSYVTNAPHAPNPKAKKKKKKRKKKK